MGDTGGPAATRGFAPGRPNPASELMNVVIEALASRVSAAGDAASVHFISGEVSVKTTTAVAPG